MASDEIIVSSIFFPFFLQLIRERTCLCQASIQSADAAMNTQPVNYSISRFPL